METSRAQATDRAALVAMATAGGAYAVSSAEARVLALLERAGLFHVGGVLLGTYAFHGHRQHAGRALVGSAPVHTRDIDVGHEEHIAVALARDLGVAGLEAGRKDPATGLELWPVPSFDPRKPSTSSMVQGTELHVNLLTPMRGRARDAPVRIAALGAAAPAAPFPRLRARGQPAGGGRRGRWRARERAEPRALRAPQAARRAEATAARRPRRGRAPSRAGRAGAARAAHQTEPDDVRRAFRELERRGAGWVRPVKASVALTRRGTPAAALGAVAGLSKA